MIRTAFFFVVALAFSALAAETAHHFVAPMVATVTSSAAVAGAR